MFHSMLATCGPEILPPCRRHKIAPVVRISCSRGSNVCEWR
jgi:hypothetical protein